MKYNRKTNGLNDEDQLSLLDFLEEQFRGANCGHNVKQSDERSRWCREWAKKNGLEYDDILKMYDTVLGWPNCDCEAFAALNHFADRRYDRGE